VSHKRSRQARLQQIWAERRSRGCFSVCFFLTFVCFLYAAQDSVFIDLLVPPDTSISPDTRPTADPFIIHSLDSSIPSPTRFAWSSRGNPRPISFALMLSEDSVFDATDLAVTDYTDTMLAVWNLKINNPYYWKICGKDSRDSQRCSPVFSFKTADAWPRMIFIEGSTNVRDIGGRKNMDGLTIKQGLFYRSAELNQNYNVTAKGIAQLMQLGIVCDIDLRNKNENPHPALPATVRYVHPITDSGQEILSYLDGLMYTSVLYRDVFKEIADYRNYPMICHCLAGADRTGTVVALLEALLGNSQRQIGDDYQWTSLSVNGIRDTNSLEWRNTIAYIRSFDRQNGTVQAGAWFYLQSVGMQVDELIAIREIFLDDDRQPFPKLGAGYRFLPLPAKSPHTVRKYFVNSSHNGIFIKRGVKRASMLSLSGKKVFDFKRNDAASDTWVAAPASGEGVYILHEYNETAPYP
jgi:protein-tyrosine phosphatase